MLSLPRRLAMFAFPLLLIAGLGAILFFTVRGGSSSTNSDSSNAVYSSTLPTSTGTADYPKGVPIVFSAITDGSGTRYPPDVAEPAEEYTVSNPVTVAMAIGAGLRYQKEGELPELNYGHLHVFTDEPLPGPLDTITADDTHIDLGDGSHKLTLPALEPGHHTISAVWTDSSNLAGAPVASATIKLFVSDTPTS